MTNDKKLKTKWPWFVRTIQVQRVSFQMDAHREGGHRCKLTGAVRTMRVIAAHCRDTDN